MSEKKMVRARDRGLDVATNKAPVDLGCSHQGKVPVGASRGRRTWAAAHVTAPLRPAALSRTAPTLRVGLASSAANGPVVGLIWLIPWMAEGLSFGTLSVFFLYFIFFTSFSFFFFFFVLFCFVLFIFPIFLLFLAFSSHLCLLSLSLSFTLAAHSSLLTLLLPHCLLPHCLPPFNAGTPYLVFLSLLFFCFVPSSPFLVLSFHNFTLPFFSFSLFLFFSFSLFLFFSFSLFLFFSFSLFLFFSFPFPSPSLTSPRPQPAPASAAL
ncbi:hypothetical protein METBIDRAFT_95547 [Metschnikowia bicuspidata var. bicuspidata NRRL YB-4993]|uniref:Uncharacterized protein n=1 Tax=Metschnikowia bicuspidata var. bicuspidata NRRL YB-4993 TaxID=869754 RepID=A0A1A0HFN4_9ASCO|nr:hypothetical protein METBIDRAFT_95547 [Metschnikowia bicuspidata var. bicuspidata NRRL YB-4993]OBA22964.1 hypothetical protein METBIDRAFT_95547 [Metschnikowia bicuspidata var. bicuspidata NRRL YB-4993]